MYAERASINSGGVGADAQPNTTGMAKSTTPRHDLEQRYWLRIMTEPSRCRQSTIDLMVDGHARSDPQRSDHARARPRADEAHYGSWLGAGAGVAGGDATGFDVSV